jgi:hypothetical protein
VALPEREKEHGIAAYLAKFGLSAISAEKLRPEEQLTELHQIVRVARRWPLASRNEARGEIGDIARRGKTDSAENMRERLKRTYYGLNREYDLKYVNLKHALYTNGLTCDYLAVNRLTS